MSCRGSWASEYIYCLPCCIALRDALLPLEGNHFTVNSARHPLRTNEVDRIMSGRLGGGGFGDGLVRFESSDIREAIETAICHPVTFALMDEGEPFQFITIAPRGAED